MRIIFLYDFFWPSIGGIELRAKKFLPALQQRGHEILVVTTRDPNDDLPEREELFGISVVRLPLRAALENRDFRQIVALKRQYSAIRAEFSPDLIHMFFSGPMGMLEVTSDLAPPAPLLASFTTWPSAEDGEPLPLVEQILQKAAGVTGNSARLAGVLNDLMPSTRPRATTVYSGNIWPGDLPKAPPMHPAVVLCIGRLIHKKGFDLAIRAMPKVIDAFPGTRLVIAGDGPALADCKVLAESLRIADQVDFLGWVAPDAINALIDEATIVIIPTRSEEAFATVAIQAAQMARPVIASRTGGMAEAVIDNETGILVDREDSAAIAAGIRLLLTDRPAALAMGTRGRERAMTLHSWDEYMETFENLYKNLKR